jgi:Holliday junction resolvase RusA-like endonuclease
VTKKRPLEFAVFVRGIPYGQNKTKGRLDAPRVWTTAVVHQTKGLPQLLGPCDFDVEFILPPDKFPSDLPYGSDLDNLLKRLLDALGSTVLRDAPGRDSVIVKLSARKRPAGPSEETGPMIGFRTIGTPPW